jgi:hypothetical protein
MMRAARKESEGRHQLKITDESLAGSEGTAHRVFFGYRRFHFLQPEVQGASSVTAALCLPSCGASPPPSAFKLPAAGSLKGLWK